MLLLYVAALLAGVYACVCIANEARICAVTHGERAEVLSSLGDLVGVEANDNAAWKRGHTDRVTPHGVVDEEVEQVR